jgi:hypothetical protein
MKRYFVLPALVATVVVMLSAPAQAQATRTWVSGTGDDTFVCSRTAPCKTFARAITQTVAGGEINCLDSAGFGTVSIFKSITINCEGAIGGIEASSGGVGVTVNAGANDTVTLRGLDIEGVAGANSGQLGIWFIGGAALHVQNCLIRNFRGGTVPIGINFVPDSGASELYVSNTVITGNGATPSQFGNVGIEFKPNFGAGKGKAVLDHVDISNNVLGFRTESSAAGITLDVTITNSTISGNSSNGVVANSVGQGAVQVMIDHTSIVNNGAVGVRGDGNATIRMANSNVTGNTTGTSLTTGAALASYGNNHINGNGSNGPDPTVIAQK